MLKTCPNPIDVQDLQFKLQCRLKVFDNNDFSAFTSPSLLSCASRYGLLFVGSNSSNLQVIQVKCVENYSPKDKDISEYPRRNVTLPSPAKHVCVNCDSTILAVVIEKDKCSTVIFYDVLSFLRQNVTVIKEARLSPTPGVYITETNWNPSLPPIFTACKSDGTLGIYEIKDTSISINELPKAAEATSFCWSPKGKQIAVGSKNGKITQYKPDLQAVKLVHEPPLGAPHSLISLQWVSNYQFIGIYQSAAAEGSAKLVVVDAPKAGEVSYTNYEDVCYSGTGRLPQFYMILQQHCTELGVLGSAGDTWTQWVISDSARAELPLGPDHQETFPVGLALDVSSTRPLSWNESTIPPARTSSCCPIRVSCACSTSSTSRRAYRAFVHRQIPSRTRAVFLSVPLSQPPFTSQPKVLSQPQPTFAPSGNLFGAKPAEGKPLFGAQVTLTPINPQQPASLFGGQTLITPISKPQVSAPVTAPSSDKYAAVFSAMSAPAPAPAHSKPIVISTSAAPKSESVEQPKPAAPAPRAAEAKPTSDAKIKGEKEALLAQMIRDECVSLESELKALLRQGRSSKVDVGTEEEKTEMVLKVEALQQFVKEIVDISVGENAEVHYLKQNLIQCWAWFEEARSRYNCSKDEAMSMLQRSQPLDSATEKRQQDMRTLMYYIESQISQASKALDEQWDNFQDYAKKTHRTKTPTMEAIFQTMVRQNAVLQKQLYNEGYRQQAEEQDSWHRRAFAVALLENTKDIEDDLKQLRLDHPQDVYQLQYERVLRRMKSLSASKTDKLRRLLKTREVHHVTAVKPQLSSSLVLRSPEGKTRQLLSNLLSQTTQVSPVSKTGAVPRQLTFVHSTPIREPSVEIKPAQTPPNTPQVDAKPFSFKKIEKATSSGTAIATTSGFVPLVKTTSVFSNLSQTPSQPSLPTHTLSAFVPTTQVSFAMSKPFSFATTTVILKPTVAEAAPSAFSLGAAGSLPKFEAAVPKTTSLAATTSATKTFVPTVKTTLPQFSFGSSVSVTPVVSKKPDSTTSAFGSGTAAKPAFNFGANIFGPKVEVSQYRTKPLSFTFTNKTSDGAQGKPSSIFSGLTSTAASTTTTAASKQTLSFGGTAGAEKSIFGATTAPSTTVAALPGASIFGGTTATPKLTMFSTTQPATSTTAVPTTSISSSAAATTSTVVLTSSAVTTSTAVLTSPVAADSTTPESTKPAVTASSGTGSIFGATAPVVATTAQTASIFAPATSSAPKVSIFSPGTTQPSIFATATSPITTQASIFASAAPTTQSSIFSDTSTTTQPSIFATSSPATTASSIFGTTTQASPFGASPAATTSSSVFGTTTQSSIFGKPASPTTTTSSVFGGTTTTTQSVFGTSTTPTTTSIFGSATVGQPVFGTSTATTTSSIFGGTTTTTQSSIFATPISSATTKPSIFGTAASTQPSVFGTSGSTQQSSIFGSSTGTNQTSIFGGVTGPVSTQASVFAAGSAAPTTKPSVFGVTQPAPVSQSSIFATGSVPSTQPAAGSPFSGFGSPTATTTFSSPFGQSSSIFGAPKTTASPFGTTFGGSGVFGSAPATTASVFGQPSSFGSNSTSVFGTPTTTSSIFGGGTGGSTFGTPSSTTNVFGSPAASPSSFSFAGAAGNAGNAGSFGFGGLNVGGTATTSSNVFGGSAGFGSTAPQANPFGRTAEQKSPFGGGGSIFGSPASTASPAFGSGTGSIFGSNTQSGFGTSTFGSPSAFGQQSTFGQGTFGGGSFGNSPGPFSGGGAAVGQTGFGSSAAFQKPSGFGSPPAFGGSPQPAFGAAPSFGGAPAFGATPAFGSPGKIFGSNTPTGFGSAAPVTTGFGNLANQNTVGFGSLAQQAATPSSTPFAGSSSFSSWR
ncbi:hypothetical protein NQ318_019645 [Aromia moschata]|uniref:Nucleoporin Nup159/Nup146 N-terminal domain-containing protein n=1 Tax=Aromia moschata TaxID=1265417 RepID=A0AAV8Z431_9CUCU|nr:hypothetical protein NQ318_019645 [Aromia moschata]